uniref:Uncharacterized protein n=1 Tax=Fagus sylvatica TaxID=28930 RepID=A0A2N9GX15_FAGSY
MVARSLSCEGEVEIALRHLRSADPNLSAISGDCVVEGVLAMEIGASAGLGYGDHAPKLRLKKTPKGLALASIEPHATSAMEVPSKESVDQEVEKADEKIKFFEKHKTKRKVLQDTRLSKKLLNSSKGVALHVARMKSARGSNYSFGGSLSGG